MHRTCGKGFINNYKQEFPENILSMLLTYFITKDCIEYTS